MKIKVKREDKVIFNTTLELSFEDDDTNVKLDHEDKFRISVYDKKREIMRYYNIVNGKVVLDEVENLGDYMLRDDIRDKMLEILRSMDFKVDSEEDYFKNIQFDFINIEDFFQELYREFGINNIVLNGTQKWKKIADVVDYIEDRLECAV